MSCEKDAISGSILRVKFMGTCLATRGLIADTNLIRLIAGGFGRRTCSISFVLDGQSLYKSPKEEDGNQGGSLA